MISIVNYLFEVLGDPKWTDRLNARGRQYTSASNTSGVGDDTSRKLYLMGIRAHNLAKRNEITSNFDEIQKEIKEDPVKPYHMLQYISKLKSANRKSTDELYPARVKVREQNEARKASDAKSVEQNKRMQNINNAKALLPKSLQIRGN